MERVYTTRPSFVENPKSPMALLAAASYVDPSRGNNSLLFVTAVFTFATTWPLRSRVYLDLTTFGPCYRQCFCSKCPELIR